jgi:hypothetical protein
MPLYMKQSAILLFLTLFVVESHGQKFSINELYLMLQSGYETFDTKILQKGFEFDSAFNADNYTAYHYTLDRTKEGKAIKHISWTSWTDGRTYIGYQIIDKKEYLSFKEELKKLGFKLIKTETVIGYLYLDYKLGKKLVTLASGKTGKDDPVNTFYEISVEYTQ